MIAAAFDAEGFPLGLILRRCAYDDHGVPTFPDDDYEPQGLVAGKVADAVREALR